MRPLGEVIDDEGDSLDEGLTGRGAGHEPHLAVVLVGTRNAGDAAERGHDTLAELGFERILPDEFQHADEDLLDLGVLRLDPPYLIAHDAMRGRASDKDRCRGAGSKNQPVAARCRSRMARL
jgi:hypothetical protein